MAVETKTEKDKDSASLYRPVFCRIVRISDLTPTEKLFRIEMPEGRDLNQKPGQFVQVSILGLGEAPISVSSSPTRRGYFELGVRNAGALTNALHQLKVGDEVGIRGPFGTFFDVEKFKGKDMLLISGGCGLAPMRSLIQYCEDRRGEFGKTFVIYGAKAPADVLYKDELEIWQGSDIFETHVTVDNIPQGTCYDGHVGLITTLIPPLEIEPEKSIAVVVGPPVMYRFVIMELKKKGIREEQIVVSLERYMKCGVGKCGHCTIEHLYCCLDGPVFWFNEISNLRGAI
ncbi:FAD/NAD(P)-binding protein [Candidatus Sumerlaeota bacterium]|nr:FAD/NAD(P)-binding protein [Candidatus Sumerlaeota bacterium]